MGFADIVIIIVVVAVVALIVRGMLKGSIRSCDCSSCSGSCDCCGHPHSASRIKPTRTQRKHLRGLKEHGAN